MTSYNSTEYGFTSFTSTDSSFTSTDSSSVPSHNAAMDIVQLRGQYGTRAAIKDFGTITRTKKPSEPEKINVLGSPEPITTKIPLKKSYGKLTNKKQLEVAILYEAATKNHTYKTLIKAITDIAAKKASNNLFSCSIKTEEIMQELIHKNRLIHTPLNKIVVVSIEGQVDCRMCVPFGYTVTLMTDLSEGIGATRNYFCSTCKARFFDGRWYDEDNWYNYIEEVWKVRKQDNNERINNNRQ